MAKKPEELILELRGKLGAATKRANDEREFSLKQLTIESAMKDERARLVNMLVIALLALESGVPNEVVYFMKERLADELIAIFPAVSRRLGRDEHQNIGG